MLLLIILETDYCSLSLSVFPSMIYDNQLIIEAAQPRNRKGRTFKLVCKHAGSGGRKRKIVILTCQR